MKTGIYFLLKGKKLVYIGETMDFPNRVSQHKDKVFDNVRFIECESPASYFYEQRLIKYFKPKYNKTYGAPPKHAFNGLKVGKKALLTGSAEKYPYQFIGQYNNTHDEKLKIVRDGNKIFAERIA